MVAPMQKRDRTKERVKWAYSGGKTTDEAFPYHVKDENGKSKWDKATPEERKKKGWISERNIGKYRAELVAEGELVDITPKDRGKAQTKYAPKEEVGGLSKKEDFDIAKEEQTLPVPKGVLVSMVIDEARDIIKAIEKDDAWKNKRKIRKICHDIRPVNEKIGYLNQLGYSVSEPWDYFKKEAPPMWKGLFGWKNLKGIIGIPVNGEPVIVDENEKVIAVPELIYPSLPEWKGYLLTVIAELESSTVIPDGKTRVKPMTRLQARRKNRRSRPGAANDKEPEKDAGDEGSEERLRVSAINGRRGRSSALWGRERAPGLPCPDGPLPDIEVPLPVEAPALSRLLAPFRT